MAYGHNKNHPHGRQNYVVAINSLDSSWNKAAEDEAKTDDDKDSCSNEQRRRNERMKIIKEKKNETNADFSYTLFLLLLCVARGLTPFSGLGLPPKQRHNEYGWIFFFFLRIYIYFFSVSLFFYFAPRVYFYFVIVYVIFVGRMNLHCPIGEAAHCDDNTRYSVDQISCKFDKNWVESGHKRANFEFNS